MSVAVALAAAFVFWLTMTQKTSEPAESKKEDVKKPATSRKRPAPRSTKRGKKKGKKDSSDSESDQDNDSDSECDSCEYVSDDEEDDKSFKKQKTSTSTFQKRVGWMPFWIKLDDKTSICDVPGDGDCLFSAVELSKLTLENNHRKKHTFFDASGLRKAAERLRKRTIKYMKENSEEIRPFMQDDETLEMHLKKMEKKSCWAEEVHVQVLTKIFQQPIFLYRKSKNVVLVTNKYGEEFYGIDQSGDNVIRIFYEPEHYQAICQC
jgi:hypothetical protein